MPAGSLDRWPDDYERGRPGWPREVVEIPGLSPTATVLDLGAGTGKLTRLLVDAFRRVVAVEPAEPMGRRLAALCPEAELLAGTAQQIPVGDASVDAVFAGEASRTRSSSRSGRRDYRIRRRSTGKASSPSSRRWDGSPTSQTTSG